jgi:hypothetical protein
MVQLLSYPKSQSFLILITFYKSILKSKELKLSSVALNPMSSNVKVSESPNHFMTLDAIARGMNSIDKIARATKLHKSDVELIINDLTNQRLIIRAETRGFFGNKKLKLSITDTGFRLLNVKKRN